ncbi:Exonuclease [Streptomyces sp. 2112.2]|uniref:3'-5' exonuclease n=1 Tax=Streptomyces sp. 2112.2 TaxID=1881024 RepID=UPI0008941DF6|nr:3'-5' exonuclease [Streptomyces sp. 2112.2]SEF16373.1 Exonuclease [Streptomyces sp. 2112.2]
MTAPTTTAPTVADGATVPAQPVAHHAGVPVYRAGEAPPDLYTKTQLAPHRRKLAPGQQPAAYVRLTMPYRGTVPIALYTLADAEPMPPLSPRQEAAKRARRTCLLCGTVASAPLPHRRGAWLPRSGPVCRPCDEAHHDRYLRTCGRCGAEWQQRDSVDGRRCRPCRDAENHGRQVAERLTRRHCPDCQRQTATRDEIEAADAAEPYNFLSLDFPRVCKPCQAERQHRADEARRADERARWSELGPVRAWARRIVAAPHEYAIVDTETTGLEGDVRVVEIAVTDGAGNELLNTVINPGVPIPEDAAAIHGLTDEDVRDAPTFGAILPRLTEALRGRRVVIYNRDYDTGVVANELDHHHRAQAPTLPGVPLPPHAVHPAAAAWMDAQEWDRCAMKAYAVHIGEWSNYWGGWKWQRLNGGHRAAGDCRAVAFLLRDIAQTPDPF